MNTLCARPPSTLGVAITLCVSLLLSGCTSTRFYSPNTVNLPAEVRVGEHVNCWMSDGTQKAFAVTAVEPDALVGEAVRVRVADIASVEVTRFDRKKTLKQTWKVAGVVLWVTAEAVAAIH